MSKIIRTPNREAGRFFGRDVDDLIEGFFKPVRAFPANWTENLPALDIVEHKNKYTISAEMPGMDKDNIHVTYDNGVLSISGEKKEESKKEEDGKVIHQECTYGNYLRQFSLSHEIDEAGISAKYKNGVLTLTVPKAKESTPERIKIDIQ